MADNIEIEVQVDFPSVSELQQKLASKWKRIEDNFEAKINVDVNRQSIEKIKKRIRESLKKDTFEIKIGANISEALESIKKLNGELKALDNQLSKARSLDFNVSFKDILMDVKKIDQAMVNAQSNIKNQTDALKEQAGQWTKISNLVREVRDSEGNIVNKTTQKITSKGDLGKSTVTTIKPDGLIDTEFVLNRERALKEIEDVLKRIHQIELDQINAEGKHYELLEQERKLQLEQLNLLKEQYQSIYKANPLSDDEVKQLKRQQDLALEIKTILALKKQEQDQEREIAQAVTKVAQLEEAKIQVQKKMVNALESEKESLQALYDHYDKIQNRIKESYDLEKNMSQAQKDELANVQTIGSLEIERLRAKKEQKEYEERLSEQEKVFRREQSEALKILKSSLKEVYDLQLKIREIESRRDYGGAFTDKDNAKLSDLKARLNIAEENLNVYKKLFSTMGLVDGKMEDQLSALTRIYNQERKRIDETIKFVAQQDKINRKQKELEEIEKQIKQLQRDLIYAGVRESQIIEKEIAQLEKKASVVKGELRALGSLVDERDRELEAIKKLQAEQRQLNKLRQDARDRDRTFNDSVAIIDPYTTFNNFRQAAMAIFEPIERLDTALTQVKKVASATDDVFQKFAEDSFDTASKLGITADQYFQAVEKWVTAGYNLQQSQKLAQISQIGAFVGNISPDDMVKYMSVPLKAFEEEGLKADDIINVMNQDANDFAVEMDDLGKAFQRSSTTVKTAGVSFKELTGLITGAQEATRIGGERIGTALKTIAINYNLIKSQITKNNQKKFQFFESIGINLDKTKSLTDALEKLHEKWDKLNQKQKTDALYYLAGKEHANILSGIMNQWDTVTASMHTAESQLGLGKMGSAYQEMAKQSDSVRFKIAELKNTWDKLMVTIGNSNHGIVHDTLDFLITGLEDIQKIASNDQVMTLIKYILAGVAIHASYNAIAKYFNTMVTGINAFITKGKEARDLWNQLRKSADKARESEERALSVNASSSVVGSVGAGKKSESKSNKDEKTYVPVSAGYRTEKEDKKIPDNTEEKLSKVNEAGDKAISKAGTFLRFLGKIVGFVPILGDALAVLDLMGVPVFEKMGEAVNKVFGHTKDLNAELQKTARITLAKNSLLNGQALSRDDTAKSLEKEFYQDTKGKGYMTADQFQKFKRRFNKFAEDNNLKVRITFNDYDEVRKKIKELKRELAELKAKDKKNFGKEYDKQFKEQRKAYDKIDDLKDERKALLARKKQDQELLKMLKGKKNKSDSDYSLLASTQADLDKVDKKIKKTTKSIKDEQKVIKTTGNNIKTYTKSLADYVKKTGNLHGFSSKTVKQFLGQMIDQYNKLNGRIRKVKDAQKDLNSTNGISKKKWEELIKLYPELSKWDYKEVNNNKKIKAAVQEKLKKYEESGKKKMEEADKAIKAAAKEIGAEKDIKHAKDGSIQATQKLEKEIDRASEKIRKAPTKKETNWIVKIKQVFSGFINKLFGHGKKDSKSDSIAVGTISNDVATNPIASPSVAVPASGAKTIGKIVSAASTSSADTAVSAPSGNIVKSDAKIPSVGVVSYNKSSSDNSYRVSSDIWRYWGTELYTGEKLESAMDKLTRAIEMADDNQSKLISLYQQQQSLLKQQIAYQNKLKSEKNSEINSVLSQLKKYGFKVDYASNKVLNLSHAKSLKGSKAEKAEDLLNTWRSLYEDIIGINNTIGDLNKSLYETSQNIKDAKIKHELEKFDSLLKSIDATLTKVENDNNIFGSKLDLIGNNDKELALYTNEQAMANAKSNLSTLIDKFNQLSKATINYEENGEALKSQLESLGQEIITEADNIVKYNQAINDIEINRVVDDMNEFTKAIDENNNRLSNSINALKEGLVSGTDLSDLESSKSVDLDLSRKDIFEQLAQERINLEQKVYDALNAFAKKNIDREKGVANTILKINKNMYNQLLKMKKDYTNGKLASSSKIDVSFNPDDFTGVASIDKDYSNVLKKLNSYFDEVRKKQDELTKEYEDKMSKIIDSDQREALTNEYIINSMKLQEEYYQQKIKGYQDAINELKNQLKDSTLTDDKRQQIEDQIQEYEDNIIDAQNNIRESIKDRFNFEFSLLDKAVSKYDDLAKDLQYAYDIVNAIAGKNYDAKNTILQIMYENGLERNEQIKESIAQLQQELSLYEQGSLEWNLINDELKQYNSLLQDSNKELVEMNKNILDNSFSETVSNIEHTLFNGQSQSEFQRQQELWLTGIEKEIALEQMYERMAELQTDLNADRMAILEKQEKISKYEMDYLNKQLDILELQNKVNNLTNERTVQVLQQNADGSWQWTYQADQTALSEAQKQLDQAQLDLQKMQDQAKSDYFSKLQDILKEAEDGSYSSVDAFKKDLQDLADTYSLILNGLPEITDNYLQQLVDSYAQYIDNNNQIADSSAPSISTTNPTEPTTPYHREIYIKSVSLNVDDNLKKTFNDVGQSMGQIIGDTIVDALQKVYPVNDKETGNTTIQIENIQFPNITTPEGLQDAILSLPQIALQRTKSQV